MRSNLFIYVLVSLLTLLYFNFIVNLGFYESFSIGLMAFCFFDFLDNIGKKVVVLDIAIIVAIFTWLVMPVIFYQYYTKEDHLARIFYKYMPIPAEEYFSFVLPGTLAMIIGFKLRLSRLAINNDSGAYKAKLEQFFKGKARIGFILIGISLGSSVLYYVIPASFNHIVNLAEHLSYVGVFYIFFSDYKHKNIVLSSVLGLLAVTAIIQGVFGELVFLLALFYILIAIYLKKVPFFTKASVCISGIFLIFLIQNVKKTYRERAWVTGADPVYFMQLIGQSIEDPSLMFQKKTLFGAAIRMNQGWLIAITMDRVPRRFAFANGETIATSIAAAFIPRVIWPDKPEAGGRYNLKRFWGYELRGYSMNIGPIGEAYANFGKVGGIIFMFFYGLFFNGLLTFLLKWSEKRPTILCWIPFLFFHAVVVETDILTTVSSIVTSLIFMLLFIRLFKAAFHIKI